MNCCFSPADIFALAAETLMDWSAACVATFPPPPHATKIYDAQSTTPKVHWKEDAENRIDARTASLRRVSTMVSSASRMNFEIQTPAINRRSLCRATYFVN